MGNLENVQPWKGFKDFVVYKKVMENAEVSSLYLKPVDGEKVVLPKGGQFITIKINSGDEKYDVVRSYSLSNKPNNDYYKITVRKVEDGRASVYLTNVVEEGDVVGVRPPAGRFCLKDAPKERPIVLIGAGIGITPVLSILKDTIGKRDNIKYVEIFRNSDYQVLHEEVEQFVADKMIDNIVFYTRPLEKNELGKDHHVQGYITKEWIADNLPLDADFYFCGSKDFSKSLQTYLTELEIAKEDINFEFF